MESAWAALTFLADSAPTWTVPSQYGPVIGVAVTLCGGAWAVVRFLFHRIEESHKEHVETLVQSIRREEERAEKSEKRADQYEQELKTNVRVWFEQVAPTMNAAVRAIDAVTEQLRRNEERR